MVSVDIIFNPDGSLARSPSIIDNGREQGVSEEDFQTAARSAIGAVYRCAPFKMPVESYDVWRHVVLMFKPEDMVSDQ